MISKSHVDPVEREPVNSYISEDAFIWDDRVPARNNYQELGKRLARSGSLFRNPQHGSGLVQLVPNGQFKPIASGDDLLPVMIDRLDVLVTKGGCTKRGTISPRHLKAMLRSERFLSQFSALDHISSAPVYLPDFSFASPGYNDNGPGHRVYYVGKRPVIAKGYETISQFLDVMAFDMPADRTNAVAAALTVLLRNHWPGGKPIILVTATKSHSGKDTVIMFATGQQRSVAISYQATNWALEQSFVAAAKGNPDAAVIVIENARLDARNPQIASAFLERFATDAEPLLFSSKTGSAIQGPNRYVLAMSTNFGMVSQDILNRALPIHLAPKGDVTGESLIGNPKLEFLPNNREQIASELYGMIERWKEAGHPPDATVRHPFSVWAKTIGGILKVNEFTDFLGNYNSRRTTDDPVRHGLAILGATRPNDRLPVAEWADLVADLGLTNRIIPVGDQGSQAGRTRGLGKVLSAHQAETLVFQDDGREIGLRLEQVRKRFSKGQQPQVRYRFSTQPIATPTPEPQRLELDTAAIVRGTATSA